MRRPPQRRSRGSTHLEVAVVLVMLGLLGSIAVPRFLSARDNARKAEVRQNLKTWYLTERAFYQEEGRYEEDFREIGFTVERGNRYAYYFGWWMNCELRDTATPTPPPSTAYPASCIGVDHYYANPYSPSLPAFTSFQATHSGLPAFQGTSPGDPGLGTSSCPDCNISAVAVGNLDDDIIKTDTWYVSTDDAEITQGTCGTHRTSVQAGQVFNVIDDVDC